MTGPLKYGEPSREEHTVSDHDVISAVYLRKHTDMPEAVIRCVEMHNGPRGAGNVLSTDLEQLHHQADRIASCRAARFSVMAPCREGRETFQEPLEVEVTQNTRIIRGNPDYSRA